jgi:hypothetical protein
MHEEDFFTVLLRLRYIYHLTEVATLEVAKKLYLMPCELMHWHESGFLGGTKPANQLVAYIRKSGDDLKGILDTLIKVCLCTICIMWASFHDDAGPVGQAYALKSLTHETKQQWTIVLLRIG